MLQAPFPYFGGKARAASVVWSLFGDVDNYVEPFAGSAAMLLNAPEGKRVETLNDADGFVANFWRAVAWEPEAVAHYANWPVSEVDLESRHAWLLNRSERLRWQLEDPDFYDAKIAGYWCWGACAWIGSGWCSGEGPHQTNGARIFNARQLPHVGNAGRGINRKLPHVGNAGRGINRQLPHVGNAGQGINRKLPHVGDAGQGINRKLPHVGDAGQGINRKLPHMGDAGRGAFIREWMLRLHDRLRDVRITCGDWTRVVAPSVTTRHGLTALFLDPPYTKGAMDYAAGGVGGQLASDVRAWCAEHGDDPKLRIVLCGHAGEHDDLLSRGWRIETWKARKGYALKDEARENSAGETLWYSPQCVRQTTALELVV